MTAAQPIERMATWRRIDRSRLTPHLLAADQLDEALDLLDDASAWLRSKGIAGQWPTSFRDPSASDVNRDRIGELRKYADLGQLWVLRDSGHGGQAVATATVTHLPDMDFASQWPDGTSGHHFSASLWDARYLCRMAAARSVSGHGVGAAMVDFAGWLARNAGVSVLRLDCSKTNAKLHAYYEGIGFKRVGTAEVPGRLSGALFQKLV